MISYNRSFIYFFIIANTLRNEFLWFKSPSYKLYDIKSDKNFPLQNEENC